MTIQIGQALPDLPIAVINGEADIQRTTTAPLFAERNVVLFAVPGAFTPTCSERHMPGYVRHFDAFKARGTEVYCLAVNDAYVMKAWALSQHVPAGLKLLADGNGAFTKALGLEMDGSAYGMGMRSRRFALYAENGVVKSLHVESPGELRVSTAEAMLDTLSQ
ncbi:peroxiredoxin [Dyella nitratireducens]|uniref:Glutathione-dependent peroxiredoxin n=1 Tax=Dyella nitratireducens TaxID=1849580 RepID=A0ABQ1FKP1_9GAMM|nr:peroxiredoxin [Dyella nitratireducens]GGA17888.1 peroxiredoxin [Dyella nitratireducens]GLQ44730.1 peroxiredoxin [Dyella nitratireducens]